LQPGLSLTLNPPLPTLHLSRAGFSGAQRRAQPKRKLETIMNTEILEHYLRCALWSSCDENDNHFDDCFEPSDVAEESRKQSLEEIDDFLADLENQGIDWQSEMTLEQFGHDFWLTRNGHGAGFWDRGLGELGDKLSDMAKVYGSADPYIGDDEELYIA
jgi:hypothetical protein